MDVSIRKAFVIGSSALALMAVGYAMNGALHSPLFVVRVVEVADQPDESPVDAQKISDLAAVPVGLVNLFDLDLRPIEQRILTNPWIREVRLQKRFPQTLSISVIYREPQALIQVEGGNLAYVDVDGKVFGRVSLNVSSDLPVLLGFLPESPTRIREALNLMSRWSKAPLAKLAQISQLSWDLERGYRALVTYPLVAGNAGSKDRSFGRTMVEFGTDIDSTFDHQLSRLSDVLHYLSGNSIAARQIWADAGKKIVVKTAHGS